MNLDQCHTLHQSADNMDIPRITNQDKLKYAVAYGNLDELKDLTNLKDIDYTQPVCRSDDNSELTPLEYSLKFRTNIKIVFQLFMKVDSQDIWNRILQNIVYTEELINILNRLKSKEANSKFNEILENTTVSDLDFSNMKLNLENIKALIKNKNVKNLNLSDIAVNDEWFKVLAESTNLEKLRLRSARGNISDNGAKLFKNNTSLKSLDLSNNRVLTSETARALAENKTLTELDLSNNSIDDEGAKALAANDTLRILNLSNNSIDDEGAKALAANDTLRILNLSDNKIGDEGAIALSKNTTLTSLSLDQLYIHEYNNEEEDYKKLTDVGRNALLNMNNYRKKIAESNKHTNKLIMNRNNNPFFDRINMGNIINKNLEYTPIKVIVE
jgi:hypothetical protein